MVIHKFSVVVRLSKFWILSFFSIFRLFDNDDSPCFMELNIYVDDLSLDRLLSDNTHSHLI